MSDYPEKRNLLTDTVILGASTAYIYLVTFFYEFGYCYYFDIPKHLISPSLTTILISAAAIGGALLSSLKILGLTAPIFRASVDEKRVAFHPFLRMNAILLIIVLLLLNVYGWSLEAFCWLTGGLLLLNFMNFGPVLFMRKKKIEERFEVMNDDEDKLDIIVLLKKRFGHLPIQFIAILLAIIGLSFATGNGEAKRQIEFYTILSRPGVAILRTYGDTMVCCKYDASKRIMSNELFLLQMSKFDELVLVKQKIGPIKFSKNMITGGPRVVLSSRPR